MNVIKLISPLKETYFAPEWDITLGGFQYEDQEKFYNIQKFLIDKEQDIRDLPLNDDAGTGVGTDSITARYGKYNLFQFIDECKELQELLDFFRRSYIEYCSHHGAPVEEVDIVCWYNILRDSEPMNVHVHSCKPDSYISGNMQFSSFESYTFYRPPQDAFGGVNIPGPPGQLVLFPSYIPHGVQHDYEGTRISVAFDLHRHIANNPEPHWGCNLPFMNEKIYNNSCNS